jgi:hypothetical protein
MHFMQSHGCQEIDFKGFQGKYDFFYMPMEAGLQGLRSRAVKPAVKPCGV